MQRLIETELDEHDAAALLRAASRQVWPRWCVESIDIADDLPPSQDGDRLLAGAAPDLARAVIRIAAERDWYHLALLCEQGKTHDDAGEPLPWTVAGWEDEQVSWWLVQDKCRVAIVAETRDGFDWWLTGSACAGSCSTRLAAIIAAHAALGLPPLDGVPEVSDAVG